MKIRRCIVPMVKNITAEMTEGVMVLKILVEDGRELKLYLYAAGGEERDRLWEICDGIQRAGAGSYEEKGTVS